MERVKIVPRAYICELLSRICIQSEILNNQLVIYSYGVPDDRKQTIATRYNCCWKYTTVRSLGHFSTCLGRCRRCKSYATNWPLDWKMCAKNNRRKCDFPRIVKYDKLFVVDNYDTVVPRSSLLKNDLQLVDSAGICELLLLAKYFDKGAAMSCFAMDVLLIVLNMTMSGLKWKLVRRYPISK